ncbi:MAG: polymer-forming cytoskeletal protein [Bacteroidota bacterium]
MYRQAFLLLATLCASTLLTSSGFAQPGSEALDLANTDILVRIDRDLVVPTEASAPPTFVLNGDARIDGTVRDGFVVLNGSANVQGHIDGTVVVVGGTLSLGPDARVRDDVVLIESTLWRDPGALVGGEVARSGALSPVVGVFFWISCTIAALLGGLLYVFLVGARSRPVVTALDQPGQTALVGAVLMVGLPLLALAFIASGIGLVIGASIALNVIPVLAVLGYVISGVALGQLLRDRFDRMHNPYVATLVGVGLLQVFVALPLLGLLSMLAAPFGAGALFLALWRYHERRAGAKTNAQNAAYAAA